MREMYSCTSIEIERFIYIYIIKPFKNKIKERKGREREGESEAEGGFKIYSKLKVKRKTERKGRIHNEQCKPTYMTGGQSEGQLGLCPRKALRKAWGR